MLHTKVKMQDTVVAINVIESSMQVLYTIHVYMYMIGYQCIIGLHYQ